jgi:hypothetical protein
MMQRGVNLEPINALEAQIEALKKQLDEANALISDLIAINAATPVGLESLTDRAFEYGKKYYLLGAEVVL